MFEPRFMFAALLSCLMTSCGGQGSAASSQEPQKPTVPFDAERAWQMLQDQVAFGPRPAGSPENAKTRDWIVAQLQAAGLNPVREAFTAKDAPGGSIAMENIYADLEAPASAKGELAPMIVLGAHFDTKRMPFPFVGANDGASGTATLLELARVLKAGPTPAVTYRFLFFDGEEAVRREWVDPDNCYGSKHHTLELTKIKGAHKRIKVFILLDLIGDSDLVLEDDSNSTRDLRDIFKRTASEIGQPQLFSDISLPIRDDHESFLNWGIPAIDLIDLHYGKYDNEYWHTEQDTVDKCSAKSLETIGRLVLAALPKVQAKYCK